MIEKFKVSKEGINEAESEDKADWINLVEPTAAEISELNTKFNISQFPINSLKDIEEIPLIEHYDSTILIISRIATKYVGELDFSTVPLGIFIANKKIFTICFFKNDLLNLMKEQKFKFTTSDFLLKLLLKSSRLYLSYLKVINAEMYKTEKSLEKSQKNEEIIKLLDIEKSLVYFTTSLKADQLLLEKISRMEKIIKTKKETELITDVIDENRQAIETTSIYSDILSSTMDAFASVIANNLNIVIKMLASITIIIALPTLIASIYGMNVELPFQHSVFAFWIVMLMSSILAVSGVIIFWRYKLF